MDPYRRNSGPLDARYLNDVTVDLDAVARFWRTIELPEHQSTDRFDLLAFEVPSQSIVNVRQLDSSVNVVPLIVTLAYRGFALIEIKPVSKVSDEGLNDVFNRCNPLECSPLVDDRRHLLSILPELYQEIANCHCLGDDENVAGDVIDYLGIPIVNLCSQHVLDIYESNHLVTVVGIKYRIARVSGL